MTPLEIYYQKKAKQQKPDELLTRQAALSLIGKDPGILLKKNHPGLFMQLLDVLDRPGNATRALLVGKMGGLKGLIPFASVLEDLTGIPFALKKNDRVPGTELIETWFGKQTQRPGKIDPVDALGTVAEIVLDPLWLVGGAGITKLGKAKQLIQGASKAAIKDPVVYEKMMGAIRAAGNGEQIPSDIGKHMANAIRTVYGAGNTPKLATSWAEQAARGERAVLTIAGKPVVLGGKTFWDAAEKGTETFRKSYLGEKLLAGYRRVAPKYDKMPDIYIHNVRDQVVTQSARASSLAGRMGKEFESMGVPDVSILTGDIHQLKGLIEKTPDQIQKEIAETLQRGNKPITKLSGHYNAIAKQRTGVEARLSEARQQYGKPLNLDEYAVPSTGGVSYNKIPPDVSVVRGRGIVRRLSKMENELNRLKFSGRREDVFKIQRLQKIIKNLEQKGLQNKDTVAYLTKVRPIEQRLRELDNELFKTNKRITGFYRRAQDPNRRPIRRLLERQRMAEGKVGELLSSVPESVRPQILEQVKRFKGLAEGQIASERAANIKVGELDSALGYMRRWLTPEAHAFKEANQDKIMFQVRATRPTGGFAKRRKGYMEDLTREEVNDIWKKSGFEGANVFEPNIHKAWSGREMESIRSKGVANAVNESARTFRTKTATQDTVPLREYYEKIGMNVPDGVDGFHIPKEIMNVFTAVKANPGGIDKFWKFWTGLNRLTKGLFTLPMPAYYMKNIIGDVALGYLDGVVKPRVYFDSIRINISARKTAKIAERSGISFEDASARVNWPKIVTQFGEMDGREVWRLGQEHGVTGQTLGIMHISELPTGQQVKPGTGRVSRFLQGQGKAWDVGRGVAETTENWTRMAHFVDKMGKGMDPMSAAKQVKSFHFDYGDLSEWEKKIARDRLFFFYCVPEEYEILTRDGWKKHDDLKIGESVLGYNTEKMEGEWTTVNDIAVFDYDDDLLWFKKQKKTAIDIMFTEHHRWPVRTYTSYGKIRHEVVLGEQLKRHHSLLYSAPFNDWPEESLFTPREAALIGWLITDGTMSGRNNNNWRIFQHPKKFANEIRELIGKDGLKESHSGHGGVLSFGINQDYRRYLQSKGFQSKKDAIWICTRLSKDAAYAMWDAMYKADGVTVPHRTQDSFACEQDDVFDTAQILVQLHGFHMHRSAKGGYIARKQGQYCKIDQKVTKKHYKGKIWCPNTGTGTWVMRANGKVIITGNTFSRKNLPRQVQSLAKTPGKQAAFSHLAGGTPTIQGEGQQYPDWMQEQFIGKTPFRDANNLPIKMFSTGLPIEEAFGRFAAPGVGWQRIRRLAARNIAQLQPAITKPIELATGKGLYFDKPITNWNQWAMEASPMGRFAGTYRQATAPMESVPAKVNNFITGVRFRSFDAEKAKQYKLKEIARKYLATHGASASPTYYVPKDKRKGMSIPMQVALQSQ